MAKRKKNRPGLQPFIPGSDLTRRAARRERRSAARLKFGEAQRDLAERRRSSQQAEQNIGNWYEQYQRDVAAAQNTVANIYSGANAQVAQLQANQGDPRSGLDAARLTGQAAAQAASTGAQAANARRSLAGSFGAMLATQGAANQAQLVNQGVIGGRSRVQALEDEMRRRRDLDEQRTDLKREKGDFKRLYRSEQLDRERKYGLERAAFGLDQFEARTDAANARRDDRRAARENRRERLEKRREDVYGMPRAEYEALSRSEKLRAKAEWEAAGRAPSKGSDKGLTPAEQRARRKERRERRQDRRETWTTIETVRDLYRTYKAVKNDKGQSPTPAQVRARLIEEGYTADHITIAGAPIQSVWSPEQIAAAKRLGIKVPARNRPTGYSKGSGRPD